MKLVVRVTMERSESFHIDINPSDRLLHIIEVISKRQGLQLDETSFHFINKTYTYKNVKEETKTAEDVGMKDMSSITLIGRCFGGY